MKSTNSTKSVLVLKMVLFTLFIIGGGLTVQVASAQASFQPACPFAAQAGRTIVHFEDQSLSGGVRSDAGSDRAYKTVTASIPAGTYDVRLQSFDGGTAESRDYQPHEQYYLQLKNGGTVVAQTNSTVDLADNIATPVWYGQVNSGLVLSQNVNTITAVSLTYPDSSSPNSVNVGCAAFDLVIPPTPAVTASCSASPSSVNTGSPVTWTASATGGNGTYSYSWVGTDSLTGFGVSTSHTYSTAGTKVATVAITSGSMVATSNCSAVVNAPVANLAVTCSANPATSQTGSPITWTANATGGTGTYAYSWVGSDSLVGSGSTASQTYTSAGTKVATVVVTSGGFTATANCSAVITAPTANLTASCIASPSTTTMGNTVTYIPTVSGGTGVYTHVWTSDCTGTGSTCSNSYSTVGTKTANLTVTSGSQTATANCSAVITAPTVNLTASCYASPSSITSGQTTTFIGTATGGTGAYTYLWSGLCLGSGQTCSNTFYGTGAQTVTLTVLSGSQSANATCSVNVGTTCSPNYQQRCIGNSMYWFDSCGAQGAYIASCGVTNSTLNLTKTVRDLTIGTAFSNSTYANPGDILMYMITLQANGNADVQNVFVRDTLPVNLIYNNQLVIACSGSGNYNNCNNNNYYNYSGNITSGVNLGTMYAGQTVTITYQVQVAPAASFAFGTTTLNNLVNATATNVGYIPTATASAIVSRAGVLGASTISTGLTNNFWVDSFFLPLLLTLIGIWMWKSGMFFGFERWLDNKKKVSRGYKAEKELAQKIADLQRSGRV